MAVTPCRPVNSPERAREMGADHSGIGGRMGHEELGRTYPVHGARCAKVYDRQDTRRHL
jgi:hypothetical protein